MQHNTSERIFKPSRYTGKHIILEDDNSTNKTFEFCATIFCSTNILFIEQIILQFNLLNIIKNTIVIESNQISIIVQKQDVSKTRRGERFIGCAQGYNKNS